MNKPIVGSRVRYIQGQHVPTGTLGTVLQARDSGSHGDSIYAVRWDDGLRSEGVHLGYRIELVNETRKEIKQENMKMKQLNVTYASIIKDGAVAPGDHVFIPPSFLSGGQHRDDLGNYAADEFYRHYGSVRTYCYGTFDRDGNIYMNSGRRYRLPNPMPLKHSLNDIVIFANSHTAVATIKPTDEQAKAIGQVLRLINPKKDTKIFISQIYIDKDCGYEGYCIFLGYGMIGVGFNNRYFSCKIEPNADYDTVFSCFNAKYKDGMPLKPFSYKTLLELSTKNGYKYATDKIERELSDVNKTIRNYTKNIRDYRSQYREYLSLHKEAEKYKATLPEPMQKMIDRGMSELSTVARDMKDWGQTCRTYIKRLNEVKNNKTFIKSCRDNMGEDFKAIKKMLKNGVIESITYVPGKGISWTYPPMTHEYAKGYKAFLGRPRITLNETGDGPIRIELPSYEPNTHAGTYHFDGTMGGFNYCLGQFEPIIYNLIAMGKVSDLILVMRDYLNSSNEHSKLINPAFGLMSLAGPVVIDDSFKVWKAKEDAKNAKIKEEAKLGI